MKKIILFLIVGWLFWLTIGKAEAVNNKVGIHILETVEVGRAAELVNSSGGDWGYVTIVLRDDDLDKNKWQKFMDDCRRLHLIPIIRIATHMENASPQSATRQGYWAKPKMEELDQWVNFLNSLNWPVKEQVVVLFNEPNHSKEWGGEINPQEYVSLVDSLIQKFNDSSSNFYLMLAGLDQAADGRNGTMREEQFLVEMVEAMPDIFEKVDGWCSHSYPRNFVGLPSGQGKASIRGYEWELNLVKSSSSSSSSKVLENIYITETGWGNFDEEKAADFMVQALAIWQADEQVKAVTPFVLNYPEAPFEKFSWLKKDGGVKQSYEKVLGVSKLRGEPEQIESFSVVDLKLADILPTDYEYKGKVRIKNTGQWIMGEENPEPRILNLELRDVDRVCQVVQVPELDGLVEPGEEVELDFEVKTGTQSGECRLEIGDKVHTIYTFKPFELRNENVSLWQQIKTRIKLWWKERRE